MQSIKIAPPNSILLIADRSGGVVPSITRGQRIWSTPSCIVFGCLAFMDGETDVTLGVATDVDPGTPPAFEGLLETPNLSVVVSTVEWKTVLWAQVLSKKTWIRIWTNRSQEPDKVVIGIG
jgi:hypothetical protein